MRRSSSSSQLSGTTLSAWPPWMRVTVRLAFADQIVAAATHLLVGGPLRSALKGARLVNGVNPQLRRAGVRGDAFYTAREDASCLCEPRRSHSMSARQSPRNQSPAECRVRKIRPFAGDLFIGGEHAHQGAGPALTVGGQQTQGFTIATSGPLASQAPRPYRRPSRSLRVKDRSPSRCPPERCRYGC